jgi:hypothetical protein
MFNNKHPDIIAITIFFIIVGLIYIYPSIFIFYLITLTVLLYITFSLAYHKISGENQIKKMYKIVSYIQQYEQKAEFSNNLIGVMQETKLDLIQFPKNKKLFIEKKIFVQKVDSEVSILRHTDYFVNYLAKQDSAENALTKKYYVI